MNDKRKMIDEEPIIKTKETAAAAEEIPFKDRLKYVLCVIVAPIVIMYLLLGVFFGFTHISGSSMNPTLYNGNFAIIQRWNYEPKRGDIVVADVHRFPTIMEERSYQERLIKRVIALPGDVLEFDEANQVIYLNGEALTEPYLAPNEVVDSIDRGTEPFVVPEGHVFLMGDNRQHSLDSRALGVWDVAMEDIIGGVLFVIGTRS